MNLIKYAIVIAVLAGFASQAAAQRVVEKTFPADPAERVTLNLKFGDRITVRAWDNNEVSFRAEIEINGGALDDALLLEFADDASGIAVSADYDGERIKEGRREDCPSRHSTISWSSGEGGYAVCATITYTVFVPRRSDLTVDTISGDIEMEGLEGPVDARSISGYVDLSWPEGREADLSLKTVTGEAFSDLESIRFTNRQQSAPLVGYRLNGMIGEGGPDIRLESVSGDIFLRRS